MIVHVVADEVTDTLKAVVLCPNLCSRKEGVSSGAKSKAAERRQLYCGMRKGKKTGMEDCPPRPLRLLEKGVPQLALAAGPETEKLRDTASPDLLGGLSQRRTPTPRNLGEGDGDCCGEEPKARRDSGLATGRQGEP